MIPTDLIDEFVRRLREAGGANVESVILFGSAATGDYHPGLSNLNVLCILGDSSFRSLQTLAPAAKWWDKQKQPPPLCMTRLELDRSTDVFTIELLDMKQHHRVLFGADLLSGLQILMDLHRVQVEYELREKLILLRQHILIADGNDSKLWDLMLRSVASFSTLFRHALIALGDSSKSTRREAVQALSQRLGFDPSAVLQVLDAREKQVDRGKVNVADLAGRYLAAVERVTAAVDTALDEKTPGRA
jgi:nucleotidyltransferase-like protein